MNDWKTELDSMCILVNGRPMSFNVSPTKIEHFIESLLTSQKEAFLKAIEGKRKDIVRDNQRVTKIHRLSRGESFNAGLDAALEAIKSV